jgi:putative iron-regulated protein
VEGHNEAGGESNVATGYHAIEFLLWGQDLTDPSETKPGQRSFQDYVEGGDTQNADRRGAYLLVVGDLLVANLQQVHQEWAAGGTYRATFEADADQAFENILTGMTILSGFETGGERLQAALDSGEQEDEHSCFSDNTHRDMIQDVQGVWNVWTGTYTKVDGTQISGTSIKSVVEQVAPDLAASLDSRITTSLQLANAMQVPFDLAIATSNGEGRAGVQALVESLLIQESLLEDVFDAFQLEVPVAE